MAKIVKVTYGTQGMTNEYAYLVNDNVRTGDYIHPSVKHYLSGKIFGTTGIVQSTAKTTSANGQKQLADLQGKVNFNGEPIKVVQALTGKEAGAKAQRGEGGRFVGGSGLGKTEKDYVPMYDGDTLAKRHIAPEGTEFAPSQYIRQTRQANVEYRERQEGLSQQNVSHETFDSYSAKFKNNDKGENQ